MTYSLRREQLIEVLTLHILEELENSNSYLLENYEHLDEASFKDFLQKIKKGAKTAALTGGIALSTMGAGKAMSANVPNTGKDRTPTEQPVRLSSDTLKKATLPSSSITSGRPDTIDHYRKFSSGTVQEWTYIGINDSTFSSISSRLFKSLKVHSDAIPNILEALNQDSERFSDDANRALSYIVNLYNQDELTASTLLMFLEAISSEYPNSFYYTGDPKGLTKRGVQPSVWYRDASNNMYQLFPLGIIKTT